MPLRIAFDLDGVLANMGAELDRWAETLFAESNAPSELSSSQQSQLWQHIETIENFWERLEELEEGAVGRLARAAGERRWDILFVTTRPRTAGATVQIQSQRWLQSKGFPLPSVYVVHGSRGKVASALDLDVVVDDRLENCLDVVADSTARPVLFIGRASADDPMPAGAERIGITVVQTMERCLELLTTLDDSLRRPEPGLVQRVMRTLGMSGSAKPKTPKS
jgi:hypothetical protein